MTLYWWSHWFWITLIGNLLFITIVHTYPSQEISLKYNQNSKPLKTVTKLNPTTSTLTWATTPPSNSRIIDVAAESTVLHSMQSETEKEDELLEFTEADEENDTVAVEAEADHMNLGEATDEAMNVDDNRTEEIEFKRSAENFNKTTECSEEHPTSENNKEVAAEAAADKKVDDAENTSKTAGTGTVKLKREDAEVNNYTNFSSSANVASTNVSNDIHKNAVPANSTQPFAATNKSSSAVPAVPAAPRINSAHSTLEWFNTLAAELPPTDVTANSDAIDTVTPAHKAPFTLENVNKEEELRRAETEHRSRKSKVLSAEYKHINRFINFSSDSKSLLARSASTAPNEFENDEGNISSEALSIQRTYFLDAGAISAICFTVFGICCTVGTIGIVLYRRRYWNKPQTLSEPDSSVYIDDSTMRVSDNSDEMYSLDNDSFLNSLEAMTIQNYWTDTVKHTKL